ADPSLGPRDPAPAHGTQVAGRAAGDRSVRGLYERAGGLGPLPSTRIEASAIRASFPDATVKLEGDAQESLVKQSAGNYRYLHFAAHALFNDAAPTLSGVVLARPPQGSPED